MSDKETKAKVDSFIENFVLCKTICKSILKEYFKAGNEKIKDEDIVLDVRRIKGAFNYYGYTYDDNIMSDIFGAKKNDKGNKSLKILRNEILHDSKPEAINEVVKRNVEIMQLVDSFVNMITEQGNAA